MEGHINGGDIHMKGYRHKRTHIWRDIYMGKIYI